MLNHNIETQANKEKDRQYDSWKAPNSSITESKDTEVFEMLDK
jgi:hypothetical protein